MEKNARFKALSVTFLVAVVLLLVVVLAFSDTKTVYEETTLDGYDAVGVRDFSWINPTTWYSEDYDTYLVKRPFWDLDYLDGIQEEYFDYSIENLANAQAKICLLPKPGTNLRISDKIVLDSRATIFSNNVQSRLVQPADMETEIEAGKLKKMCINVNGNAEDSVKFGSHSAAFELINENLALQDSNGSLISEIELTTENFEYKNGKPNKKLGVGLDQKLHEFTIKGYTSYSDIIDGLTAIDMNTGEPIDRNLVLKRAVYENITVPVYSPEYCTYANLTDYVCGRVLNGSKVTTLASWEVINPLDISNGSAENISVFGDIYEGDYYDILFDYAGIDIGSFWATLEGSILYEYLDTSGDHDQTSGDRALAQSFTVGTVGANVEIEVNGVGLELERQGTIGTYQIRIEGADGSGYPNGTLYYYNTFDASSISNAGEVWYNITLNNIAGVTLKPSTQYAVVIRGATGGDDASNRLKWEVDVGGGNPYAGGLASGANSNSSTWAGLGGGLYDHSFEIWGNAGADNPPTVNLVSPSNGSTYAIGSVDFSCYASDDINLVNVSFIVNDLINQTNTTGLNNTNYSFSLSNLGEGNYTWTCQGTDNSSQSTNATVRTFSIDTTPFIEFISPTEANGSVVPHNWIYAKANLTETLFENLTFVLYNGSGVLNTTTYTDMTRDVNWTGFSDGLYWYNATVWTNTSTTNSTENRQIEIDTTAPIITLTSPTGIYGLVSPGDSLNLNWTVADSNIDTCSYRYPSIGNIIYEDNANWNDGNISTYTTIDGYYYMNWTGGTNFIGFGAYFTSSGLGNSYNTTLPLACSSQTPKRARLNSVDSSNIVRLQCYDGGSWINVLTAADSSAVHPSDIYTSPRTVYYEVNCSANFTPLYYSTGNNNLTFYANDTVGGEASATTSWLVNLSEINQTYPSSTVESAVETYTATIFYNSSRFNIITGTLYLNESSELATKTTNGNYVTFTSQIEVPGVSVQTNFTPQWTISLTDEDGTIDYNLSATPQVTVDPIVFGLCNATLNVSFWNFTVLNESNGAEINASFDATFILRKTGSSSENIFNYSDNSALNSQFDFCITPTAENYTIDTIIQLAKTGYVNKNYNYDDVIVTNATRQDNLYMLANGDSTSYIIQVEYANSEDIINAEVKVERYYPGTATWNVIEILTTNYLGEAVGHLLSEDASYRFKVSVGGRNIYNSTSTTIVCAISPCTVTLVVPLNVNTGLEQLDNLETSLTYNKNTDLFTYSYSDSSGNFDRARLKVIRIFPTNATEVVICNSTKTSATGVLTCDITGNINGTYYAEGFITRDGEETLTDSLTGKLGIAISDSLGVDGVLWAMFIFMAITMVGIARPSLAIIFGIIAFIFLAILNIVNVGPLSIIAIVTIGIILLVRVKRE